MVLRRDGRGVLAVGQASHAWLCGQLARAWGNERFGAVSPLEEVALGAEQHDVGMARRDLRPARNPATGLPQSFIEMDVAENLALWRAGPSRLITQSRYAALLATLHGRRLYARRDLESAPAAEAELVRDFLDHCTALASALRDTLAADESEIERNSRLVWTWDSLSLALLLDWAPFTLREVPTADGPPAELELSPDGTLNPWPFAADAVTLRCEGRRLTETFASDEAMHEGLAGASWETLSFDLHPSAGRPRTL